MLRHTRSLLLAGVAFGLVAGAVPGRAATVTADQATAMEQQFRDWLSSLAGNQAKLPERPLQITAAGDHFNVALPLLNLMPLTGAGAATGTPTVTAQLTPLDGGKWGLGAVQVPSPLTFTVQVPLPPPGDPKGKPVPTPVTYTTNFKGYDVKGLWDPSFASTSSISTAIQGVTMEAKGGTLNMHGSAGPGTSMTTLSPAGGDRVDLKQDAAIQDYTIQTDTDQAGPVGFTAKKVAFNLGVNGASRDKVMAIVQTAMALGRAQMEAKQAGKDPVPPSPQAMHALLDGVRELARDGGFSETLEGMSIEVQGMKAGLARFQIGGGGRSENGLLNAGMDIGAAGLTLPDNLPIGELGALVPTRIALKPFAGGVPVDAVYNILNMSIDNKQPAPADIAALFAKGGLKAGLDSLAIEAAGALIAGKGTVIMTSPNDFTGEAHITADRFDALMQKVSSIPEAAQAVPVLALVKGMGKAVNNQIVWDVVYKDKKILVNGVDLSAMAGGGGGNRPNQRQGQPGQGPAKPR